MANCYLPERRSSLGSEIGSATDSCSSCELDVSTADPFSSTSESSHPGEAVPIPPSARRLSQPRDIQTLQIVGPPYSGALHEAAAVIRLIAAQTRQRESV